MKLYKTKLAKSLNIILGLGLSGILVVSSGCAVQPVLVTPKTDKVVGIVPQQTPYEAAHDLEFSFEFDNTGGFNLDPERMANPDRNSPYFIFGTGWLFDWDTTSTKPVNNNGDINWTGYFATNLHVADALLKSDDGIYTPSWLSPNGQGGDSTIGFSLGKLYNQNPGFLNSNANGANLTSVPLSTLPSTFYTATNYYQPNRTVAASQPDRNIYTDFAVLQIQIHYRKNPINNQQRGESEAYQNWIEPAMNLISLMGANYTSFFDSKDYISLNKNKTPIHPLPTQIYAGGYPFYSMGDTFGNVSPPHYTSNSRTVSGANFGNPTGSPAWTINAKKTKDEANGSLTYTPPGLVSKSQTDEFTDNNPNTSVDGTYSPYDPNLPLETNNPNVPKATTLFYHGVQYVQYGLGYIVSDSNLAGGASGTMILHQDSNPAGFQLLAIYFGTFADPNNPSLESSVGIGIALIIDSFTSSDGNYEYLSPYNLIAGNSLMRSAAKVGELNQIFNSSYKVSLQVKNISSHWFPNSN
ncbi:DUF31 family putative serine protease [[Mycoplasma] testudinis]|uniref:DUF31 family putative serine protease n=1 Tax=[Mycoplasma] testudinis TaxID=33924 RepID=UPI0004832977|nr:hypothetical protein [[Mycoplasma] testudinis]